MFLTSAAFRGLDAAQWRSWDWRATSVLLISFEWDPSRGGPEALAARRLAAPLTEAGARVHVVTSSADAGRFEPYGVTVVPDVPVSDNRLLRQWQMLRHRIPESQCRWVAAAVRAGAHVLASLPSDAIVYGRAMPGSCNIAAWSLARTAGVPFVAHFSDEWPSVQMQSSRWARFAPHQALLFGLWRKRILRDAGALTFTNPGQAMAVLGRDAGRYASKAFVVTHLPTEATPRRRPQQYDVFHLVHTGNLNPPGHTSEGLMRGLRLFLDRTPAARGKVRFTQAGWNDGDMRDWAARCGLTEVVRFAGRMSRPEIEQTLNDASLLIGVDYARPNSTTLLSKLPDYINAARPILVLAAPSSVMGRLFAEDHVGLTARYDDPHEVAARISLVFDAWNRRSPNELLPGAAASESFARTHALDELAAAFAVARSSRAAATRQAGSRHARVAREVTP